MKFWLRKKIFLEQNGRRLAQTLFETARLYSEVGRPTAQRNQSYNYCYLLPGTDRPVRQDSSVIGRSGSAGMLKLCLLWIPSCIMFSYGRNGREGNVSRILPSSHCGSNHKGQRSSGVWIIGQCLVKLRCSSISQLASPLWNQGPVAQCNAFQILNTFRS